MPAFVCRWVEQGGDDGGIVRIGREAEFLGERFGDDDGEVVGRDSELVVLDGVDEDDRAFGVGGFADGHGACGPWEIRGALRASGRALVRSEIDLKAPGAANAAPGSQIPAQDGAAGQDAALTTWEPGARVTGL